MKKYKRTRIIANIAVMGSLAWSSTTFAATSTPITWGNRVKENTDISISRPIRAHAEATSTPETKKRKMRAATVRLKHDMLPAKYPGTIISLTTSGFTISKSNFGLHASSTTPITYNVTTSTSTVYMKDGKLDSATDIISGQHVIVTGPIDITTATITATGVNIITNPRPRVK
jgi:hypothetical protein